MEDLFIDTAHNSPKVTFSDNGTMELYGRSIPEYASRFYRPLYEWMEEYIKSPAPITEFTLKLDYLNSSSTKQVTSILQLLEKVHPATTQATVVWYYESDDEEMLDVGENFEHAVELPFKMVAVDEI